MSTGRGGADGAVEILITEDSSTQAERLRHVLEQHHYRVVVAEDGRVALDWLAHHLPAMVITDINMPRLNGYDLCRQIKADKRLRDIPVILLTSLSDATDVLEGLACGADCFITKPYSEDYLVARVERTLADAALTDSGRASIEVEIPLPGQSGVITADPRRMVSLLVSTYEAAIYRNAELVQTQDALRTLNEHLEDQVEDRTAVLSAEIAERKQAEASLAASEAELRALFAAMTDVVMVLAADGRYLQIAPTNPALLVRPSSELLGRNMHEILPRTDAEIIQHHIDRALKEQRPIHVDYSLSIGGVLVWFDATISPMGEDRVIWIARDVTQRVQREHELEAIAAISTALRRANTQSEMLPIVLEQVTTLLSVSGAALAMRDPSTDELVIALSQGDSAEPTGTRLPPGAGVAGQILASGQPYVTGNAAADPHWYQTNGPSPAMALAGVPFITGQYIVGVLWAVRPAPFSGVEVRVLSAIADIAASAIQRAGLHEQTEQRLRRLAALREIDRAIMNSLDLRTTLTIILDHVASQLGVDACDILLLNRGTKNLEFAAGRGFRSKGIERTHLRLGEGHAGRAALERRLVTEPNIAGNPSVLLRVKLLATEAFASLFCMPLLAKGQVVGVLEVWTRAPLNPDSDWLGFLDTLAGQSAIAVSDAWQYTDLQRSNMEMRLAYDSTLEGWSAALDLRDEETEGHSQRVTDMALKLASAMGVSDDEREQIRRGALLHDIGKMGVPDAILSKPGKLSDEEWVVMRQHPGNAYKLLSPITFLRRALDIPYCHHEKWDGTGYPRQLKGDEIPLSARIFAVVDVWDALRSNRPYRLGWADEKVLDHIREQAGKHFDPQVVSTFLVLVEMAQETIP